MSKHDYEFYYTLEYESWFEGESPKSKWQIQKRLGQIQNESHFGNHKYLGNSLWELKFNDGRRIYYIHLRQSNLLLLLGGNKNGQDKDIFKAKNLLEKFTKKKNK